MHYPIAVLRVLLVILFFQSINAEAETVQIAAGEYPPFLSEHLPEHGVIGAIATAVVRAQGGEPKYTYLPWKRGYVESEQGIYVATFPYLKTPEREAAFHYSEPIYTDHFRMFANRSDQPHPGWMTKRVCIPLGYDSTQIDDFITKNKIAVERPSSISNCFNMLHARRVDAVWASQLVGSDTLVALFGSAAGTDALDIGFKGNSNYYIIISRKRPDATQWLAKINAGLKAIKADGTYKKILAKFSVN